MNNQEKLYRLVQSRTDILQASSYLRELKDRNLNADDCIFGDRKDDRIIFEALVESFVMSYSRSFKKSNNKDGKKEDGSVGEGIENYIPDSYKDIHDRIVNDRDKFHAHSDINSLGLSIGDWSIGDSIWKNIPTSHNPFGTWSEGYIGETSDLLDIVIDAIFELIEKEDDNSNDPSQT